MRRIEASFFSRCAACAGGFLALLAGLLPAQQQGLALRWLEDSAPQIACGVRWGVPWPRGQYRAGTRFRLVRGDARVPLQSWPLAFWPDGSIKWSGFAATLKAAAGADAAPLRVEAVEGENASARSGVRVRPTETFWDIDVGSHSLRIAKWGGALIDSIRVGDVEVARRVHLQCILQHGVRDDAVVARPRTRFRSVVEKVSIEQRGPVRAVVKIEGRHRAEGGSRSFLPFVLRMYLYANAPEIRMVHTIVFDGEADEDFVRGMALVAEVPMREETHNRHVRFSGDGAGLWAEPVQPMVGRPRRFARARGSEEDLFPQQLRGDRVPNRDGIDERGQQFLADWAIWNDFKLTQLSADGFRIEKRTNAQSAWISAGAGRRSSGLAFVGDVSGGLAVGVRNFWQSHPASLEIRNANGSAAQLYAWLWSPDGPAMDMRHYDTKPHGLQAAYEDVQPGFSTPHGVARTSELTLYPCAGVPDRQRLAEMARLASTPPILVCAPTHYHAVRAFGIWSLPDSSTPFRTSIEKRLKALLDFYVGEVEQQRWYGFWDFGDVMHSYDSTRHVWRYDLGGHAWDNSELGTDMWLWHSFLRTGRADVFRMAEAMTRHTSEVDCYHLGRFRGMGSRHNVRHWGCGAKEVRISQAAYRRHYYYLTSDERTGDLLRESLESDRAVARLDPMRLAQPITEKEKVHPARLRLGPDWLALVGNWMTEWERTQDTKWRDKIYAGFDSLAGMKYGLRSGKNLVMGFDPASGALFQTSDQIGNYNLMTIMGGAELVFELNDIVDHPEWQRMWLQFCRLHSAPADVFERDRETGTEGGDGRFARPDRLAAYAYMKTGKRAFAERALQYLTRSRGRRATAARRLEGPEVLRPVDEIDWINTNDAAQFSLVAMQVLEMCKDALPLEMPMVKERKR